MTAALIRRPVQTAPHPEKIKGTLLDLTGVQAAGPMPEVEGLYTSFNCLVTDAVTDMCPDTPASKTFSGPVTVEGQRFAVYTGITCRPIGLDFAEFGADLKRVQANNASRAVERALMQDRFTGNVDGTDPAEDLTPAGGAVSPRAGLAILEGALGANYAGIGIIHAPRTIASFLDGFGVLDFSGAHITTSLGTDFVAGAGYEDSNGPDGSPADPGEYWMWATGRISVAAGREVAPPAQLAYGTNDLRQLVEQFYVVSVDCYIAAVRVTIE